MVGEVLRFVYNGGQRAGQYRTVFICEDYGTTVKGYDFDVKAMRTYTRSKISNMTTLQRGKDYFAVDTESLPSIYDLQDVMDDYEIKKQPVFYNEKTDQIIVLKNDAPIDTGSQTGWFGFTKDRKNVLFSLYNGKLSFIVR